MTKPKHVKVYATSTCPYCKMEKQWLDKQNIVHDYVVLDYDEAAAREMVQKTGQMGVPVTEFTYDGAPTEYVIGFDVPELSRRLSPNTN